MVFFILHLYAMSKELKFDKVEEITIGSRSLRNCWNCWNFGTLRSGLISRELTYSNLQTVSPFSFLRYCINSSSLNFHPAEKTGDDDTDGKPHEILKHTATIQGCGADGFCTLQGRKDAMKKQMEALKVSPEKDAVKQVT